MTETKSDRASRWRDPLSIVVPALIAYVPLLLTKPDVIGADTKTYLYLDPGKLLSGAPYVWDYQIGFGTVTHQNIGYLFPMGPFYWFFDKVGAPDWIAQRLWIASVMFAAGMGVRYLLRSLTRTADGDTVGGGFRLGMGQAGILVATLAYMLSPYLLDYSARISVILLPWAALPWLIALAAKAVRYGGWRYPAWFAFVVLLVGGINATALIMIGLGPLLWVLHAVWVDREVTPREALAACGRIAALTLMTSLWWIAGLSAEGRFGLPVIRYTESYRAVAQAANAPEVLRGLGYWFFYGNDKLGPWTEPSLEYTTHTPLLALSYALPIIAFAAAALVRWRYRAYFIALIFFGALVAVGSHPWDHPSFLGLLFKEFTRTDAGLSLRSTPRAVPLVVLGTAVFLGAGIDSLSCRLPKLTVPLTALTGLLLLANIPTLWNGTMVASNLERPQDIPDYWVQDANYLQSKGNDTRVLEIPGAEFAAYRWGNTVDPILPGLMERPYVARELFQWGSPPSANLLNALDRRFHEESMDPAALAPIARLMGVGDINVRSDMQYERYRIARPRTLWDLIRRTPGLGTPTTFGPSDPPNDAPLPQTMIDEVQLSADPSLPSPPRVAAIPVTDALPILRTETAAQPMLMAADGEGLVDAASQGLVNPLQPIFYSASFANNQAGFDQVYGSGADLMLTDTNRKRSRRWGSLRENTGYTERAGETPLTFDPTDQRLDVFPGATDDSSSVSEQRPAPGSTTGATVTATAYGNPVTYTPDDRPANALDGDPQTAWRVGAIADPLGEKLFIDLDKPVTTDHVNLLQPINLERTRWITKARLRFDQGTEQESTMDVDMADISRDESGVGQDVAFPSRSFQHLSIEVTDTNLGPRPLFDGVSGVGFAEVRIPGVTIQDLVRVPTDLLTKAGESSKDHRLTLLFTRLRSNPEEPVRTDEEVQIERIFNLPTPRAFSIGGTARISGYLHDDAIDQLLGMPDAAQGGVTATADVHLPGNLQQRASAAIDGDPTTFWSSIFQKQTGHWIEYTVPQPLDVDHLDLDVVADGRHSVPTKLHLTVDGQDQGVVDIPPIADLPPIDGQPQLNKTVHVTVPLPHPVRGSKLRFTIDGVREVAVPEWYSSGDTITPVAIAELGIPGLHLDPPGATFDSGCRDDLVTIDNTPVPVRVQGNTKDALAQLAMPVQPCGRAATDAGIPLGAGDHVLRTGIGRDLGINIDRLAMASNAGGAALALDQLPSQVPAPPPTTIDSSGRVDAQVTVTRTDQPFWLVLGQSWNPGWTASVNGQPLGAPTLINGYANGWHVDPATIGPGPYTLAMQWAPQRIVWVFIGISAIGVLVLLALMFFATRRRRALRALEPEPDRPLTPDLSWIWPHRPRGARPPDHGPVTRRTAVLVAIAFGLFVALNVPTQWAFPVLGLPAGAALYACLRRPARRLWLGLAAAASFGLAGAYFVIQQRRNRYNPNFVWPTLFERVHILGLTAIFLLGALALADLLRGPDRPDAGTGAPDPPDPPGSPDTPGSPESPAPSRHQEEDGRA